MEPVLWLQEAPLWPTSTERNIHFEHAANANRALLCGMETPDDCIGISDQKYQELVEAEGKVHCAEARRELNSKVARNVGVLPTKRKL